MTFKLPVLLLNILQHYTIKRQNSVKIVKIFVILHRMALVLQAPQNFERPECCYEHGIESSIRRSVLNFGILCPSG